MNILFFIIKTWNPLLIDYASLFTLYGNFQSKNYSTNFSSTKCYIIEIVKLGVLSQSMQSSDPPLTFYVRN